MQYARQEEHYHVQALLRDWNLEKGGNLSLRLEAPSGEHTVNVPVKATLGELTEIISRLTGLSNLDITHKSSSKTMSLQDRS